MKTLDAKIRSRAARRPGRKPTQPKQPAKQQPVEPKFVEARKLLDAAALAFRTPTIGRQLYGLALGAGFSEVEIRVIANPDTNGRMLNFVNNIAGYARDGGRVGITEAEIEEAVALATRALDEGRFLALNPQFMVTATV